MLYLLFFAQLTAGVETASAGTWRLLCGSVFSCLWVASWHQSSVWWPGRWCASQSEHASRHHPLGAPALCSCQIATRISTQDHCANRLVWQRLQDVTSGGAGSRWGIGCIVVLGHDSLQAGRSTSWHTCCYWRTLALLNPVGNVPSMGLCAKRCT
jgi:hypothetical protein